jgi:threonine synthase
MIPDAVRASGGTAIAVEEARLREWMQLATRLTGIPICPESAACVGALESLAQSGWIRPDERVVIFNTGAAQKYVEAMASPIPRLDCRQAIDFAALLGP